MMTATSKDSLAIRYQCPICGEGYDTMAEAVACRDDRIDCAATVCCSQCGQQEDAHGESEGEAIRNLERTLEREHWVCYDALAYCPKCARKKEEELEQAEADREAKSARGRKKKVS